MTGTSRMLAIVSRKPALVCSVRAVPTCVRGLYSLTSAENCAESATTLKPQTTASTSKTKGGAPNVSGESAAQIALTIIAAPATRAFPHSSAQRPANTQPIDPEAIDPEDPELLSDMVLAAVNEALRSAQELAARKLGGVTGGIEGMLPPGLGL